MADAILEAKRLAYVQGRTDQWVDDHGRSQFVPSADILKWCDRAKAKYPDPLPNKPVSE